MRSNDCLENRNKLLRKFPAYEDLTKNYIEKNILDMCCNKRVYSKPLNVTFYAIEMVYFHTIAYFVKYFIIAEIYYKCPIILISKTFLSKRQ